MSTKNTIRAAILAGLLAWPGVEYYRYVVAKEQLAASAELRQSVTERLAAKQKLQVPAGETPSGEVVPVKGANAENAKGSEGI